jgi:TetR/AcrR family transcriptional regulator, fatty acid metabolism regulator protein
MNEYSFIFSEEVDALMKAKNNDKYHRILEAAVKIFSRNGFHQSTIAQIAKEAGVADGTIYLYFRNKDDILVQFFSYKTKLVFSRFQEGLNQGESAVDKLRNLIRHHLEEFQSDRDMALLYQAETRRFNPLVEQQVKEMAKSYLDLLTELVEQGQQEGTIRLDLYLGLVKRFIVGAVEEVIANWLRSDGSYDIVSMADPLVDLFMRGIGNPAQAPLEAE